ncbi:MAG: glycosyltransferase family 4 protein [Candidatus Omnitrophica bacterium]|nr:glycosyltransferase family 4 protein [Candidatus Omnitrophota bacterium]
MSKKIRVAIFFPVIPNYKLPFLQRLADIPDLDVTCFHGMGKKGYSAPSTGTHLPVKSIWMKNYYWPFWGCRILWQSPIRKLLQGPYDIIICHEVIHNPANWALYALKSFHKKKLIAYGFGYRQKTLPRYIEIIHNYLRGILLRRADAVIVYTDRGRQECIEGGLKSDKIFVINNTLDTEYLMSLERDIKPQELDITRERYNLSRRPVLLYVGRLIPPKQTEVLIEAFRHLRDNPLKPTLLIVGEGMEYKSLLKRSEGLEGVHLLGPIYDDRELAKIFLVSDLLVIPGGVGLTCIHGFSYGVPIVTTGHGLKQSPEFDYIKHEENGYIVNLPRAELYADAIAYLLNNPDRLKSMRAKARQTAQSLTMNHMVSQFVNAVKYADIKE